MWEVIVCPVPAAFLVGLLPEVKELLLELTHWTEVKDVVPRDLDINRRVVHVRQQPKN